MVKVKMAQNDQESSSDYCPADVGAEKIYHC